MAVLGLNQGPEFQDVTSELFCLFRPAESDDSDHILSQLFCLPLVMLLPLFYITWGTHLSSTRCTLSASSKQVEYH